MKTKVYCDESKCIYREQMTGTCTRKIIYITRSDRPDVCSEYIPYTDTADYMNPFFICVKTEDGTLAKAEKRGMAIQHGGLLFYTPDRLSSGLFCGLTEGKTGYACGTFGQLVNNPDRLEQIREHIKKLPNVNTLPLAVWEKDDEFSGHYVLVETAQKEEAEEPEEAEETEE